MLVGTIPIASAQNSTNTTLPNWIKKNAKWWSEGSVEDRDFVQGIQYLIQKGTILHYFLPTVEFFLLTQSLRTWFVVFSLWADDKISDNDFVSGIQYLISKGIMKVSPPPTASKKQPGGYY